MLVADRAPGLYSEPIQPARADGLLARGDVPVFVGFTRRGPVRRPVRVQSLREVAALFGEAPDAGHLMPALRGFFETGGAAAYVVRLVVGDDPAEGVAAHDWANGWRAAAAFNWRLIDPNTLAAPTGDGAPAWSALVAAAVRDGASTPDPGSWGNRLAIDVARASLPLIAADAVAGSDGRRAALASLAGLEAGGIVELRQDGAAATVALIAVDAALLEVEFARPLGALGLAPGRPFALASVEYRLDVRLDGRLAERFDRVSLAPGHSRGLAAALATSGYVAIRPPAAFDAAAPGQMLPEGSVALAGGRDRVRAASDAAMLDAWTGALAACAGVDEAALVAAPDVVLLPPEPVAEAPAAAAPTDCCDLAPAPASLAGVVVDADTGEPLAGVAVTVAGQAPRATTGADGRFDLAPLPSTLLTVRLVKSGYEHGELLLQSTEIGPPAPPIELAPLAVPTRLSDNAIALVQQAMATAAGPYRVAIVDPPRPDMKPDALLTWRARLGDSDRIAFCAPWIVTPDGDAIPPSGHVCGALAAAEIAGGIARAPANVPLRFATAPTLAIDDATQGRLNPAGVDAVRAFPGRGLRLWGARTLSSDPQWRQLTARRVVDAIERTLEATLQWAVFEGNDLVTRQAAAFSVETLLARLWRQGGLAGAAPAEAYRVKCDGDNNPDATVAAGRLIVDVAVAPSVPFEFVVFRIAKSLDQLGVGG